MDNKTLKGFFSVFGAETITKIFSIAATPFLVRWLGPKQYGDYAFLLSLFAVIMVFSRDGITAGLRNFIPKNQEAQSWIRSIVTSYLHTGLLTTLLFCLGIIAVVELNVANKILSENFNIYLYYLVLVMVSDVAYQVIRYSLMSLHEERLSESIRVVNKAVFYLLGLSLVYIGLGIKGLLVAMSVANVITFIISYKYIHRTVPLRSFVSKYLGESPVYEMFRYNVSTIIFSLFLMSLYHVDIILLQLFVGSESTGIYKTALVVTGFLWFVPKAIQTTFIHSSSRLWSEERLGEIQAIAAQSTRYTVIFTVLLVVGLIPLSDSFVSLYFGNEYAEAVMPLLILLIGTLGFATSRPTFAIIQGKGNTTVLIYVTLVAAVLNLVLNLWLIPRYGKLGAAIATSIGYGLMFFLLYWAARKSGFNPLDDFRGISILISASGTLLAVTILDMGISNHLLSLIIVPPIGAGIYISMVIAMGAIDREKLDLLFGQVMNMLGKD